MYTALYTAANTRNTSGSMCWTYTFSYLPAHNPHFHLTQFPSTTSGRVDSLSLPWTQDTVLLCPLWRQLSNRPHTSASNVRIRSEQPSHCTATDHSLLRLNCQSKVVLSLLDHTETSCHTETRGTAFQNLWTMQWHWTETFFFSRYFIMYYLTFKHVLFHGLHFLTASFCFLLSGSAISSYPHFTICTSIAVHSSVQWSQCCYCMSSMYSDAVLTPHIDLKIGSSSWLLVSIQTVFILYFIRIEFCPLHFILSSQPLYLSPLQQIKETDKQKKTVS